MRRSAYEICLLSIALFSFSLQVNRPSLLFMFGLWVCTRTPSQHSKYTARGSPKLQVSLNHALVQNLPWCSKPTGCLVKEARKSQPAISNPLMGFLLAFPASQPHSLLPRQKMERCVLLRICHEVESNRRVSWWQDVGFSPPPTPNGALPQVSAPV